MGQQITVIFGADLGYKESFCAKNAKFQQKIGSIKNEFLTISAAFKKTLANKKERKIRAEKLNYKKLTKDTFKTESNKVAEALKDVDQSSGIANVEKINVILRESVRDVVIKLGSIR